MSVLADRISGRRSAAGRLTLWPRTVARSLAWSVLTIGERARQRRALQALNDHMLEDIGVTRADVMCEVGKPFWRV
jgi:uncharacterized protein YjiS (DUF1127 family)